MSDLIERLRFEVNTDNNLLEKAADEIGRLRDLASIMLCEGETIGYEEDANKRVQMRTAAINRIYQDGS